MTDLFRSRIEKLGIRPQEWLLTEGAEQMSLWELRRACVWEYARESQSLRNLIGEAFECCERFLEENSHFEIADYLFDFAGECIGSGFRAEPSAAAKLQNPQATTSVTELLRSIHTQLPLLDWRFLLSPLFPSLPWSEADEWANSRGHVLSWLGTIDAWSEQWGQQVLLGTMFQRLKCEVACSESRDGFCVKLERPLVDDLDFLLARDLRVDSEIPATLVLLPLSRINGDSPLELAQEVACRIVGRNGDSLRDGSTPAAVLLSGTVECGGNIFEPDAPSQQVLLQLRDEACRTSEHYEPLFCLCKGAPRRALNVFRSALTEIARIRGEMEFITLPFANARECVQALKDLGALRIKPHLDAKQLASLWDAESESLASVSMSVSQEGRPGERKVASLHPVYSKMDRLSSAASAARDHFRRLFPLLREQQMISEKVKTPKK